MKAATLPSQTHTICEVSLNSPEQAILLRQRCRVLAERLHLNIHAQIRLFTLSAETAFWFLSRTRDVHAKLLVRTPAPQGPPSHLDLHISYSGVPDTEAAAFLNELMHNVAGTPAQSTADETFLSASLSSSVSNGKLLLNQQLPGHPSLSLTPDFVAELRHQVEGLRQPVPLAEAIAQNRDLIATLGSLRRKNEELIQVNNEIAETNRGVVALYDELDTLHRVSNVVSAQLDLDSLINAITEATTDLSGAEVGAFFYREPRKNSYRCRSTSGPLKNFLIGCEIVDLTDIFGTDQTGHDAVRLSHHNSEVLSPFLGRTHLNVGSYLAVPVRDHVGQLVGVLVFGHRSASIFTERTERILSSVAVQVAVGLENAKLYRRVQAANAAKDQFLAMLSHELRTPLNPVFAIVSSLLQRHDLPDEVKHDVTIVQRNLELEARLIDDLLDLTRIIKGKVPLYVQHSDVHSLIANVRHICDSEIADSKVKVTFLLNAPRSWVLGDAARIQQVLWNLLNNAIKFTPAGGSIEITTFNEDSWLVIQCKDSGRGIDSNALHKIFQPFEQGDHDTTIRYGGLGLGLAISRAIIDAHKGEIKAESAGRDHGATFSVRLRALAITPELAGNSKPAERTSIKPLRILLVDDHEDTLHALERLLTRRGHTITKAGSYEAALSSAVDNHFDLLISDIGLREHSGLDLMRILHQKYQLRGIALSGYGMEADIERSREAGFMAHITKPVNVSALESAMRTVTNGGTQF